MTDQTLAVPRSGAQPMARSIFRFLVTHSLRDQIRVCLLTAASLPFYYYSLDLPKTIINTINGKGVPTDVFGWSIARLDYLWILCGAFLCLVLINGAFKYVINVLKGRLGERMLRRLRFELYHRILRFPLAQFKRVSPGELIPMITSEVEPLGGYIGDAFALPAQQGGTLLTAIFFLFMQDVLLGAAAVALYPLQAYLIPSLQRRVNRLAKQRVRAIRALADRVGETVAGIAEIHVNDAARWHLADFADRLGGIYQIRYAIYQRKFMVKFLNNFINQLTPFFFFTVGGWLVIHGRLSFGALVAVLAAYKDLAPPWKELLDFYQIKEDSRIKYEQIIEQFQPRGLIDAELQIAEPSEIPHLQGDLVLSQLSYGDEGGARAIDGLSLTLPLDQHIAIAGAPASGKVELAMLLGRLLVPDAGRILLGGQDLAQLPYAVSGRRIGYVAGATVLQAGTIRDNLLVGLRQRPVAAESGDALWQQEARRAGNIDLDIRADWVDYRRVGIGDSGALTRRLLDALAMVGFTEDLYRLGLQARLDPGAQPEAAARLIGARHALAETLAARGLRALVERFDRDRYNTNISLGENLLFGRPDDAGFAPEHLATQPDFRRILAKLGLTPDLIAIGRQIAETMIELFADLPPGHEFFEQFSFIGHEELPDYRVILRRRRLNAGDRTRLLALSLRLVQTRHRLDLIDAGLQARVVAARAVIAAQLPKRQSARIGFFDPDRYNPAASIAQNLLFGSLAYGAANAATQVNAVLHEVLAQLGLTAIVAEAGLDHPIGSGGTRLTPIQRQKLAIARAIVKRPDILILNEATALLDPVEAALVTQNLRAEFAGRSVIAILQRARTARYFDRVLVMRHGKIVESGSFAELDRPDSLFTQISQPEAI